MWAKVASAAVVLALALPPPAGAHHGTTEVRRYVAAGLGEFLACPEETGDLGFGGVCFVYGESKPVAIDLRVTDATGLPVAGWATIDLAEPGTYFCGEVTLEIGYGPADIDVWVGGINAMEVEDCGTGGQATVGQVTATYRPLN